MDAQDVELSTVDSVSINPVLCRESSLQQLELKTKERTVSVVAHPKSAPKIVMTSNSKLIFLSLIFVFSVTVFGLSVALYSSQSQTVLVSGDRLSQCSSYEQIYTFTAMSQASEIFVRAFDSSSSTLKYFNFYAQWSACDAGYMASEAKSQVFASDGVAEMASFVPWDVLSASAYAYQPFAAYSALSTDGTATQSRTGATATYYDLYYGFEEGEANSCLSLTCGQGYYGSTVPYWYTLVTANCSDTANVLGDLVEVTASIRTNENGVSASCTATVCGQVISVYQVSKSVQPSNIYQCVIKNSLENALSSAFSNTLVAYSFITQTLVIAILVSFLGVSGLYTYLRKGGEVKLSFV